MKFLTWKSFPLSFGKGDIGLQVSLPKKKINGTVEERAPTASPTFLQGQGT